MKNYIYINLHRDIMRNFIESFLHVVVLTMLSMLLMIVRSFYINVYTLREYNRRSLMLSPMLFKKNSR